MADERYADKLKGIKSAEGEAYSEMHQAALRGEVETLKLLLAQGGDARAVDDTYKMTALHFACIKGQTECAQMLIENYADVNARTTHERTPLHEATMYRHLGCTRLMVEAGGDMDAEDDNGLTPRILAHNCKGAYPELFSASQLEECDGIMELFGFNRDDLGLKPPQ